MNSKLIHIKAYSIYTLWIWPKINVSYETAISIIWNNKDSYWSKNRTRVALRKQSTFVKLVFLTELADMSLSIDMWEPMVILLAG